MDTNQRNNRPENLRWVTRLEHRLLNPITARRIEIAYGSIENFLADPSKPLPGKLPQNIGWMRTVTRKEADVSYRNLLEWAKSRGMPAGGTLGEWIYRERDQQYIEEPKSDDPIESITPGSIQKNWKTPNEFPHCPSNIGAYALNEYRQRLKEGEVFARDQYGEAQVVLAELSESKDTLVVLSNKPGAKHWYLAQVYVEDKRFVHEALGTYFSLEGATKYFTLERGLEWEGGDTFDDYVR